MLKLLLAGYSANQPVPDFNLDHHQKIMTLFII